MLDEIPNLKFSISHTTRLPRGTEKNGVEYNFVSKAIFEKMIAEDQFVEFAQVFDHYYGTSRDNIDRALQQGTDIVLDIDTEGASQVKGKFPEAVSIFIFPPSYEALRIRLFHRQSDAPEVITKRLKWAAEVEIHRYQHYDYIVVNDDLDASLETMKSIIYADRARTRRMAPQIESIIKTFGGLH
jgi:guanylate kinase